MQHALWKLSPAGKYLRFVVCTNNPFKLFQVLALATLIILQTYIIENSGGKWMSH